MVGDLHLLIFTALKFPFFQIVFGRLQEQRVPRLPYQDGDAPIRSYLSYQHNDPGNSRLAGELWIARRLNMNRESWLGLRGKSQE